MRAEKDMEEGSQRILKLAVSIGELMLRSGGEIYRVQDTIELILRSYGIEDYHVFVVSNGIFVTIHEEREDRGSMVRNVPLGSVHLERITELNQLSREICEAHLPLDEAYRRLSYCREIPEENVRSMLLAGGVGCAGFGYLYGCRWQECLLAFALGVALQWFLIFAQRLRMSKFLVNIIGGLFASAASFALAALGVPILYDKVVIGVIFLLVPGVALTTSIRELFNGDYLSGSIHLADALMTAACIAVGVGAAVKLYQMGGVSL